MCVRECECECESVCQKMIHNDDGVSLSCTHSCYLHALPSNTDLPDHLH